MSLWITRKACEAYGTISGAFRSQPAMSFGLFIVLLLVVYIHICLWNGSISQGEYATAMGTIVLGIATFILVLAQRTSNRMQFRPAVSAGIEIDWDKNRMFFVVANHGRGLAKNVRVHCTPPLVNQANTRIEDSQPFSGGYSLLAPGVKKTLNLGKAGWYIFSGGKLPRRYEMKVTYMDSDGVTYEHEYVEDLTMYEKAEFE